MNFLKKIIDNNQHPVGRAFDLMIQGLILTSLISFSIETLPNLTERSHRWLRMIETVIVIVFTVEYVLRILVAENKLKFIFSFYGLMDLLAILPYYMTTRVDLRSARAFRFLRLFRAFKMVRYSAAIQRFHRAFLIAREEIVLFVIVTVILIYFAAVGIYYFEHEAQPKVYASVFHSLWWSVVTLTTVGYGDMYPITVGGRVFTFAILLIGLGVVSVPAGLVASALQKAREMDS